MLSSSDNQARLHHVYADLLDQDTNRQNGAGADLLNLVGDLDLLLEPYRLASPPAELSRSIDLMAREMASNGTPRAPKHFWQTGPFGNRGGGGTGRPNPPSGDDDPGPPRRWSLGRELAGIAAVIVVLLLVGGALIAVFRGQNSGSLGATVEYPPLPANAIYNPGAQAVYNQGLGKHVNLTYKSNGYTLTVHWVYADAVQAIVYYSITPPPDRHPTAIGSTLSVTDAASAYGPAEPGSPGGGIPLSPDGRADFLYATQDFQPFTSKGDTITLILTFSGTHVGSPGPGGQVTDGTTMQVTVPFDPGRSIVVDKQGAIHGIDVKLDRVIVAPSGVMAMLSYPNAKSISIHQWIEALAKLSNGVNADAQEQGPINIPEHPSVIFPAPPPASLSGDWSLTLRPYESSGKLSTDQSKWLTLTFPVGSVATASLTPTILAAQPLPSNLKTDGNSIGDPNAPVKVVEWGDYQCSACQFFYVNGQTQFLKDYVATGKVFFTFRDYSFFGQQSENASAAAWCANDQGKYWEFHDTMYGNQPPEGEHKITDAFLQAVAGSIGLNMQQFNSCYDSGKYKSKVQVDLAAAKALSDAGTLNGTPTFYVNGQPVASAKYSDLKAAIDKALQQCSTRPGTLCTPPEVIGTPPSRSKAVATPSATPMATPDSLKNVPDVIGARGVQEAYAAGFGESPNTVTTVGNTKITVKWAYADSRVAFVYFDITGLPPQDSPLPPTANIGPCFTNGTVTIDSSPGLSSPANRLTGRGGGWQGNTLQCFASWFPAFGHELSSDTHTITMHINGQLGDAHSTPYSLTQSIPVVQARIAEPHLQGEVDGKPVTLDRVVVSPSATMFFLHGAGVGNPTLEHGATRRQPDRFSINDSDPLSSDGVLTGGHVSPGSSEYVYAGYYPAPARPGPWTVKVMATDANGKVVTDPSKTATFSFNLPAASWLHAASATPTP